MKKVFIVVISMLSMMVIFSANSKANANDAIEDLLQSARAKIQNHKLDEAAKDYNKVLSLDANNPDAYSGLATIYDKTGNIPNAEQYFNKVISLDKNNSSGYYGLGYIYLKKGNLDEAVGSFKKCISLSSDNAKAYQGLIRAYTSYKDKDYKAEISANMQKLKEINPGLAETLSDELALK